MSDLLARLYAASPVWLQNVEMSAFGLVWKRRRFGGRFRQMSEDFSRRERYTAAEWRDYQTQALRRLLVHAYQSVPYYSKAFRDQGVSLEDLGRFTLEDLPRLPRLPRDTMRRDPAAFLSRTATSTRLRTYQTSGTTGTPLTVAFTDAIHQAWSAAYEARARRWAGVNHCMSRAMLGGRRVVPEAGAGPPFWRYNAVERQLYLSSYHIAPSTAAHYVAALNRFRPDYVAGITSSHFFLAREMCRQGLRLQHRPRAALTSSETLTSEMRGTIEEAYGCPVFDGYAGVECCCLASECPDHQLHVSPDVGITEVLADDGRPCAPGETGEIVATGFLNTVQPFIRYRTGDLAVLSPGPCTCGRQMPVIREVIGRIEDAILKPDGGELARFDGVFKGLSGIREGQIVQEQLALIRVRLAVDPDFRDEACVVIRTRIQALLGAVDVRFAFVDRIERTERGKFRAVVSKVRRPA
jgi:phenylacetate-CoA ligase